MKPFASALIAVACRISRLEGRQPYSANWSHWAN
jgi:hypothetical protein